MADVDASPARVLSQNLDENFGSEARSGLRSIISNNGGGSLLPRDTDEGLVQDNHAARQNGWLATSALIIADIVGTGLLSLPGAFASLGMKAGVTLMILCYPINFFTGFQLNKIHLKYRSAVTFGDVGTHLFGSVGGGIMYFMLYFYLLLLLGDYLITLAKSIQGIFWSVDLCQPVATGIACVLLLPSNQFRTLGGLTVLSALSFATVCVVLAIYTATVLHKASVGEQCVAQKIEPVSGFMPVAGAISKFVFAYSGQNIYLEMQAEMKEPAKFVRSMNVGLPILASVYMALSLVSVLSCGDYTPRYILDALEYDWTRTFANVLMLAHMIVSYTISQQVLSRAIALRVFPICLTAGAKGRTTWFMLTSSLMVIGFFMANLIPLFDDFVGLMGSLLSTQMSFCVPCVLYLGAQRRYGSLMPGGLDKVMVVASFVSIAMAVTLTVTGTIDAVQTIIKDAAHDGKPFGCQCVSKTCSENEGFF